MLLAKTIINARYSIIWRRCNMWLSTRRADGRAKLKKESQRKLGGTKGRSTEESSTFVRMVVEQVFPAAGFSAWKPPVRCQSDVSLMRENKTYFYSCNLVRFWVYVYVSITLLRTIDKHRARWRGTGNRTITVSGRDEGKVCQSFPKCRSCFRGAFYFIGHSAKLFSKFPPD